jgi:hypothetical protein
VGDITSEIAAIKGEAEIKECLQSWLDLATNFTTFKNSRNEDKLVNLKPMLERFASSQCPQAEQAHIMACQIPGIVNAWQPSPQPPPSSSPVKTPSSDEAKIEKSLRTYGSV